MNILRHLLLVLFVFLGGALMFSIRNQRYETNMDISISYPTSNKVAKSFEFDDAFWGEVPKEPKVQDLLAIEKPENANDWLKSHFAVETAKNSEDILTLTIYRYQYQDEGALEAYSDLLDVIAEEIREQAEADEAIVEILQKSTIPIKTSPLSKLF